jgi:hypothetical protein
LPGIDLDLQVPFFREARSFSAMGVPQVFVGVFCYSPFPVVGLGSVSLRR